MCGGLFCLVIGVWLLVCSRSFSNSDALAGLDIMTALAGMLFVLVGVVSILMFVIALRWLA